MIECESCQEWFHGRCVGIKTHTEGTLISDFMFQKLVTEVCNHKSVFFFYSKEADLLVMFCLCEGQRCSHQTNGTNGP